MLMTEPVLRHSFQGTDFQTWTREGNKRTINSICTAE